MEKALCFESLEKKTVRCTLCRHHCTIVDGGRGLCRVRENRDGILYSLVSGIIAAKNIDPIEKKPLYHVLPGSQSYSLASVGCNFCCLHCQNADIAKYDDQGTGRMPGHLIAPEETVRCALQNGCRTIAYTYTEPTVWFEYALATARLAAETGLYNLFVTNGYISSEALGMITPVLHAANIDLKGFSDDFYHRICGAQLKEVLEGIREYKRRGIWIEITTLVIPGENDSAEQLNGIARFIADELGADTPWHVSRFFPRHRMLDCPPTPSYSLERALEAGDRAGLHYIYKGNVSGGREQTICPSCSSVVIGRSGYTITRINLKDGACGSCGKPIAGIWG
jgi:pyruvate formate lyase activating enzyme